MPTHDIFICYSSNDEAQARDIVRHLEERQYACWIACRDVRPGKNYQESIVQALRDAKILMFLFSDASNKTSEVKKELSLASSFDTAVIPFRITSSMPNGALLYELATRQWINAVGDHDEAMERLCAAIREILHAPSNAAEHGVGSPMPVQARLAVQARGPAPSPARAPIVSAGSAEFEAIRKLLAHHVGPIAKVFVQKAGSEARTADEFCEKLASHVRSSADRSAFLRAARAIL